MLLSMQPLLMGCLVPRAALRQSQNFEKRDDIQYRLGIIHKQQKKYDASLQVCL